MANIKPLTPSFRKEINKAFDKQIKELQTCKPNAIVNRQIEGLRMYKSLINGLPDGYPIPIRKCIPDVQCKLTVSIQDRRPCYCGAELREVWRRSEDKK